MLAMHKKFEKKAKRFNISRYCDITFSVSIQYYSYGVRKTMKRLFLKMASVLAALSIALALVPQTVSAASNGTADFVTRFYQLCLGRDPDPTGLKDWVDQLQSGKQTGANVARGFVLSEEFKNKKVSNDEYIDIMYEAFFDRQADASGYKTWSKALEGGLSRYYVLAGFTNSQEFINLCNSYGIQPGSLTLTDPADVYPDTAKFVYRFYKQCLGRGADPTGLNNWVSNLQSGAQTGCDVAYGFVFSKEFSDRNVSNDDFINIMYHAFFNRNADPTGYATWQKYLDAGFTRHYVLAGFVNSQEFKNLCASYNINPGSLTVLQKDSSISDVIAEKSGFEVSGSDYFRLCWYAVNTSPKDILGIMVDYYFYDNQGNPLLFDGYTNEFQHYYSHEYQGTGIAPMEEFYIEHTFLYFNMYDMGRVDIGAVELFYSDGTTQKIQYGQS